MALITSNVLPGWGVKRSGSFTKPTMELNKAELHRLQPHGLSIAEREFDEVELHRVQPPGLNTLELLGLG